MILLVIEDESWARAVLRRLLERHCDEIEFCSTLQNALFRAAQLKPDLMILDLNLPDSGIADTIAAIPQFKAIAPDSPIIAISGVADSKNVRDEVLAAGADDFVHKMDAYANDGSILVAAIIAKRDKLVREGSPRYQANQTASKMCKEVIDRQEGKS